MQKRGLKLLLAGLIVCLALLAWPTPAAAQIADVSIGRRGATSPAEDFYQTRSPLTAITNFSLTASPDDRHVKSIGFSENLTSTFFCPGPCGYAIATQFDDGGRNTMTYSLRRRYPARALFRRYIGGYCYRQAGCVGTIQNLPGRAAIPVLQTFSFTSSTAAHHIRSMGVIPSQPANGKFEVQFEFADDSPQNDGFWYSAYYVFLERSAADRERTARGEAANGDGIELGTAAANTFLQGFFLQFLNGDHHLKRLGIDLTASPQRLWFHDQNPDDRVFFEVQMADISS